MMKMEPWQMTREEWFRRSDDITIAKLPHSTKQIRRTVITEDRPVGKKGSVGIISRVSFVEMGAGNKLDGEFIHKKTIQKALADGESVPAEVLNDYPGNEFIKGEMKC